MADMMTMTPPAQNQLPEMASPQPKPPSREKMREIVGRHEAETTSRIAKRTSLETRWIEDLEQYHGRYDSATAQNLYDTDRSQLFINYTRPKTDALAARLKDLLFPTDDKNWGINPTPVPTLSDNAEAAAQRARQKQEEALAAQEQAAAAAEALPPEAPPGEEPPPETVEAEQQAGQLQQVAEAKTAEADEAKQAAGMLAARLEEAREVGALAQLRDAQLDRAGAGLPGALPVAVALRQTLGALLAIGGSGQAGDLHLHQALGRKADHLPQQVGVGGLLYEPA